MTQRVCSLAGDSKWRRGKDDEVREVASRAVIMGRDRD